jgi:hypothetical protein
MTNTMDLLTKRTFGDCSFDEEDDLKYLINDVAWIDSKSEALSETEVEALFRLVQRLQRMDIDMISIRFAKRILSDYFTEEYLEELTPEKRSSLRSIFLAAAVRELIVRNETRPKMEDARRNFLARYPFVINQDGSSTELTWLNRFERAMRYLRLVLPAKGNKKNYLEIAAHLQGSPVFMHYVPGGANPPTTQRRVDLFVKLTGIEIVKRSPREDSPAKLQKLVVKRGRGRPRKNPLATPTPKAVATPSTSRPNKRKGSVFTYDYTEEEYYNESEDEAEEEEEEQQNYIEMDSKTVANNYYSYNQMETVNNDMMENSSSCSEVHEDENDLLSFLIDQFEDPMEFIQTTPSTDSDNYSYSSHSYNRGIRAESISSDEEDLSMITSLLGY